MPSTHSQDSVLQRSRVRPPARYNVVFHNDDFTPMDFVTGVLRSIFFLTGDVAHALMWQVHTEGKAIVGTYEYDTARSKADMAISRAREEGYPLEVTVEEDADLIF